MNQTEDRAKLRIHVSNDLQEWVYPRGAVIMVAGIGGGTAGPSGIYPELAKEIITYPNLIAVQMDYRLPGEIVSCVQDLLRTINYVVSVYNVKRVVLVGWSFGGAVVISTAARHDLVKAIATIASQTADTQNVSELSKKGKACLFIHGTGDQCILSSCAEELYARAGNPKKLVLYDGDNHIMSSHRSQTKQIIRDFALQYLCAP